MSDRKIGKNMEMTCKARPIVDIIRSETLRRPNLRFSEAVTVSPCSSFGSWIKFLDHFGSTEPIGKSATIVPRIMHTAIPAGMSETLGRMHVAKVAVRGSYVTLASVQRAVCISHSPRYDIGKIHSAKPYKRGGMHRETCPPHSGPRIGSW